jgi:hypothetical protein
MIVRDLLVVGRRYGDYLVCGQCFLLPHGKAGRRAWFVCVERGGERQVIRLAKVIHAAAGRTPQWLKQRWPRLYRIWRGIIARTSNPSCTSWKFYGGRNVRLAEAWRMSFKAFKDWAVSAGYRRTLTIDRVRNADGTPANYDEASCRWVDRSTNSAWRRGLKPPSSGLRAAA